VLTSSSSYFSVLLICYQPLYVEQESDHRLRGLLGLLLPFGELSVTTLTVLSSVNLEMWLFHSSLPLITHSPVGWIPHCSLCPGF
jgi:hypothetical protein